MTCRLSRDRSGFPEQTRVHSVFLKVGAAFGIMDTVRIENTGESLKNE